MMRLIVLRPRFLRYKMGVASSCHGKQMADGGVQWGGFPTDELHPVECIGEADGLSFYCPLCFQRNGGEVGTHRINLYFEGRGVPDHMGLNLEGRPTRWHVKGNDYLDLTLSPSIHLIGSCGWHGFIEHGQIRNA